MVRNLEAAENSTCTAVYEYEVYKVELEALTGNEHEVSAPIASHFREYMACNQDRTKFPEIRCIR